MTAQIRTGPGILFAACAMIAVSAAAEEPNAEVEKSRRERLEYMKSIVDNVSVETRAASPKRLTRSEHPILRYTNPLTSAHGEGATFLWLDGKRPAAAISLSFRDKGTVYWELTSLSDGPLTAVRRAASVWTPRSASRKSEAIPDAPAPAATAAARLTQMRSLARKFQMREERRGQWQDGRLLTQPLYRWEVLDENIVDGALFGFAETTDPELLLVIEARRNANMNEARWYYLLAKMTSSPMKVSLDEKEIWSVGGYWKNPRSPEDPYVEASIGVYAAPTE